MPACDRGRGTGVQGAQKVRARRKFRRRSFHCKRRICACAHAVFMLPRPDTCAATLATYGPNGPAPRTRLAGGGHALVAAERVHALRQKHAVHLHLRREVVCEIVNRQVLVHGRGRRVGKAGRRRGRRQVGRARWWAGRLGAGRARRGRARRRRRRRGDPDGALEGGGVPEAVERSGLCVCARKGRQGECVAGRVRTNDGRRPGALSCGQGTV